MSRAGLLLGRICMSAQGHRNPAAFKLGTVKGFATRSDPRKSIHDLAKFVGLTFFKIVNVACAIHLFAEYIGTPSMMSGVSMLPTFADSGEIVIEDRLTIRLNPTGIARGDLVTLRSPIDPARIVCKRVIGLPGDIICVDPTGLKAPSTEHIVVPEGHIWISGDNAACSRDSRDYGPVSMSLLRSKLRARIWPPTEFTIFRNPTTYLA